MYNFEAIFRKLALDSSCEFWLCASYILYIEFSWFFFLRVCAFVCLSISVFVFPTLVLRFPSDIVRFISRYAFAFEFDRILFLSAHFEV